MKPFTLFISVNHNERVEIDLSDLNIHNEIMSIEDFLTSGRIELFVESMLQFYFRNYSQDKIERVKIYESLTSPKPIKDFIINHTIKQVFGLFENEIDCKTCKYYKDYLCYYDSNYPERTKPTNACNLRKEKL